MEPDYPSRQPNTITLGVYVCATNIVEQKNKTNLPIAHLHYYAYYYLAQHNEDTETTTMEK